MPDGQGINSKNGEWKNRKIQTSEIFEISEVSLWGRGEEENDEGRRVK